MPAQKKPADKLQRRNKPEVIEAQVVEINTARETPDPPEQLTGRHLDAWHAMWKDPIAATWNTAFHLEPLRRLFLLRQRVDAFEDEGYAEPSVAGSTGQTRINPLLAEARAMRAEILQLEDRFGGSAMSLMKLGVVIGAAQQSLDAMNERIAQKVGGSKTERPDPRIIDIAT